MSDYEPQVGDRVRVVLEGEVTNTFTEGAFGIAGLNSINSTHTHVVSIEKIEPPVVTFKPGDVVRDRFTGKVYALGSTSYMRLHKYQGHLPGSTQTYGPDAFSRDWFDSEHHEKIDL